MELILSGASLAVGIILAFYQIRKFVTERRTEKDANGDRAFKAEAERDAIIVASAEQAVTILQGSLRRCDEDLNKVLRRLDELEAHDRERRST